MFLYWVVLDGAIYLAIYLSDDCVLHAVKVTEKVVKEWEDFLLPLHTRIHIHNIYNHHLCPLSIARTPVL